MLSSSRANEAALQLEEH